MTLTMRPEHVTHAGRAVASVSPGEKLLCALIVAVTWLYYTMVLTANADNLGQADDFVDALWFLEIFQSRTHWSERLAVLFLPNHEHITLFNHLVYLVDVALFDQLSFTRCIVVGHVLVLGCCLVLAEWLASRINVWHAVALAVGVFLNLFYWHASFWAITALSNQAVLLFALLAARSLAKQPDAVLMPAVWALLAVASQFNGLLVLPAMLVVALCRRQGRWHAQLRLWLPLCLLTAALYVHHENPFAREHLWRHIAYTEPHLQADYQRHLPESAASTFSASSLVRAASTIIVVTGATLFDEQQLWPALIAGVAMWLWLVVMWRRKCWSAHDVFFWTVLCFVAGSLLLIGAGRGVAFGAEAGLLSRYRLYSFVLLLLCLASVLPLIGARISGWLRLPALLLLVLLVQCSSLHMLDDIAAEKQRVRLSHYYWLIDGGMGRSQMPFYPHNQDWRLFNAHERGYYSPYEALPARHRPQSLIPTDTAACAGLTSAEPVSSAAVTAFSKKARALAVELSLTVLPLPGGERLLLCGATDAVTLSLDADNINPDTGRYWPVLVLKSALPAAHYRVYRTEGGSAQSLGAIQFP